MRDESKAHAMKAHELLERIEAQEEMMKARQTNVMQKMQDDVAGVSRFVNQQQEWTLKLALAHALASVALGLGAGFSDEE